VLTGAIMVAALATIGASEWVREDLRKPWVIGSYMFVNGVRASDVNDASLLARARYVRKDADPGAESFRLQCSSCHTADGYLAIRPLIRGKSNVALEATIDRLETWRDRRMPPFVGSVEEKRALAIYLAKLGGGAIVEPKAAADGAAIFEANCAACHGPDSEWAIGPRVQGRSEAELFDILGKLPERNEMMPPFEGTDEERRALAKYLRGRA
jgi:mono/diheme cytochrome c family protein